MTIDNNIFRSIASLLICVGVLFTASSPLADTGDGGQAGEFTRNSVSIRAHSLGRAYVALADEPGGLFYNPAGLIQTKSNYAVYFMNAEPLGMSRYNVFSAALPRPVANSSSWLFGPEVAWGVSWVRFSSGEFEYRDPNDQLLEGKEFGLYQNAFALSYAREWTNTSAIWTFGATVKVIDQGITGSTDLNQSGMGVGVDLGTQIQFLSPTFVTVPLKTLIPLKLGFSVQNLIQPNVGYGGDKDKWPMLGRAGFSYDFYNLFHEDLGLILLADYEIMLVSGDRGSGIYGGAEFSWRTRHAVFSPRLGFNKVGDNKAEISLGAGITYQSDPFDLQVDLGYGQHDQLDNDFRFAATVHWGKKRDSEYFMDRTPSGTVPTLRDNLQVVASYPRFAELVDSAATALALEQDPKNEARYLTLIGGYLNAYRLYQKAFKKFHKDLDQSGGAGEALLAVREYAKSIEKESDSLPFSGRNQKHNLAYGEAWLMVAFGDDVTRDVALDSSIHILMGAEDSPKRSFLLGISNMMRGRLDAAYDHFTEVISKGDNAQSVVSIATLMRAQCLVASPAGSDERIVNQMGALRALTSGYSHRISDDYLKYRVYPDGDLADDAQYLTARCFYRINNKEEALLAYASICRFYPDSDMCSSAEMSQEMERLMDEIR